MVGFPKHGQICYSYLHPITYLFRVMTRNILLLLPVMGCTWLFGLLSINEVSLVFVWIFCILNSLQVIYSRILCILLTVVIYMSHVTLVCFVFQGLLILILHVIANPKVMLYFISSLCDDPLYGICIYSQELITHNISIFIILLLVLCSIFNSFKVT